MRPGDIITYDELCLKEKAKLQHGMNFRLPATQRTVILMSQSKNAPYADEVKNEGKTLIYEGHDVPKTKGIEDPKKLDQRMTLPSGKLTRNGIFFEAAKREKKEVVYVYEKLKKGTWVYNGAFYLMDAWLEEVDSRTVFKFQLTLCENQEINTQEAAQDLVQSRLIPSDVKKQVYKRDAGACTICGSKDNIHFDHILPFSKGGTSLKAENIQILCARHNLKKSAKIE